MIADDLFSIKKMITQLLGACHDLMVLNRIQNLNDMYRKESDHICIKLLHWQSALENT